MLDKFNISLAGVAWIIDSCLKTPTLDAVTTEVAELNNRKKSPRDAVYSKPEDNHETRIPKIEKVKKITGLNTG